MAAVRLHHAEIGGLGVLLDNIAEVFEGDAGLGVVDCEGEGLAGCFDEGDEGRVGEGAGADVVGFV